MINDLNKNGTRNLRKWPLTCGEIKAKLDREAQAIRIMRQRAAAGLCQGCYQAPCICDQSNTAGDPS
jgi:hypothetical protein